MAIHHALKKASSPSASPASRTKRVAAAAQSAKRTTRSPSPRKSASPSSSSSCSSSSTSRSSPGSSSSKKRTTREQRNIALPLSPAIAEYTNASARCSYCRKAIQYDDRHGGIGLWNFGRHLKNKHRKGTFVKGPSHELEVRGVRHAHPFEGEGAMYFDGDGDYVRKGAGAAALAIQDEDDMKEAAEMLMGLKFKEVRFAAVQSAEPSVPSPRLIPRGRL
uniref:Uncharacterized protein n=1 Tax=Schizophyllum commune (strain H4-8 / FGSC 9210) TaxID=578458 RepID=D8QB30_SCHCM